MMIKHHRNPWIGAQPLSAGARGEIDASQIDRNRADGTDAIHAEFHVKFGAKRFETSQIIEHAGRGFAVSTPEPARRCRRFQRAADFHKIETLAPRKLLRLKLQSRPLAVVEQTFAKFAVA